MAKFTRILFGSLLLAAALLKFWQISTTATPTSWSLTGTAFQWGIPLWETALAGWLFSGKRPLAALGVTTAGFAVFSGVTLFKLSQGATSCGCFGNWMVHPKITYWIDIAAVLLGAAVMLRARSAGRWRSWTGISATGAVVLGIAFGSYNEARTRAEDNAAAEQAAEISREENTGRQCCPW